ncbi:MAG: hypothetical protein ACI957_003923, partial [Verrucomicrobiales bacterium]
GVCEVTVVKEELGVIVVGIGVDVLDPLRIEGGRATNDAVDFVTFIEKEFC